MNRPRAEEVAKAIEHSILKPTATGADMEKGCREAARHGFHAVCVNPVHTRTAKDALAGSAVRVVTVIGFPLGATYTEVKVYEAMRAALSGADELDIVMNLGAATEGKWGLVEKDLSDIIAATPRLVHKVIVETSYLDMRQIERAVKASLSAGARFIKTSTGFSPVGATVEDVAFLKSIIKGRAGIKAAGGIRTLEQALGLMRAGAGRLGTSSGVRIMEEAGACPRP
ncbi:MAG: deoxyribose-phosphate aldolase [Nitrospiraceae bacterium]|nr:deoxyribose-phosphate aldolase [Nitrospiraceae bacterium]